MANMEANRADAQAGASPHARRPVRAFDPELTPLIVLRSQMEHFFCHAPVELMELYEALKLAHEVAKAAKNKDEIKRTASEMFKTYMELKGLRMDAVNVARLAAPYVHPALSSTAPPETQQEEGPAFDPHQDHLADLGKRYLSRDAEINE